MSLSEVSRHPEPQAGFSLPAALARFAKKFTAWLSRPGELPDPDSALPHPDGLAGPCTDLRVQTLIAAYAKGLYPASHRWWAPTERMVLFPENMYISKTVWRLLQTRHYTVTFDTDFEAVLRACAETRREGLTSVPTGSDMSASFMELYRAGYAHSVEVWDRSGQLAGGLYGVAVGRAFFTDKMFARVRDASNVAMVTLSCHLQHWGFVLNDGKRMSGQLSQLGFMLVPRFAFNGLLSKAAREPGRLGRWRVDEGLDVARWNPKVPGTGRARPGEPASLRAFSLSP